MTSTFALAATGALADMNFNRMASFVTYSNNAAAMAESSAEIISVSGEGMTLVYTDSPLGVIGMIDITAPSAPKALGNIDVGGEHTTVSVLGALPTWVLSQSSHSVILYVVFFNVRYGVSYRDLEEIMAERGVEIDNATLNRWVVKFSPLIAANTQARKRPTAISWRMDETYIKVRGKWTYLYRAVDRDGQTLDFMLSERRDTAAARRFFKRAVGTNGVPDRIAIDKSGANQAGLQSLNVLLKFTGSGKTIKIVQSKYLNNVVEQDHRFIKRITRPILGFKALHSAASTLAGIETAHMIR